MTSTPRLSNQAPREFSCTRVMWEMIEITYDIISNVDTSIMLIVYGSLGVMLMTLQILFADNPAERRRLCGETLRELELDIVFFIYYKLMCNMSRLIDDCLRNVAERTQRRALRNPTLRGQLNVIKCIDLLEYYLGEEKTREIMQEFKQCVLANRINLKSALLWKMIHGLRRLPETNLQVEIALLDAFWFIRTPAEARKIFSRVPYFVKFKRNIDELD